MSVCSRLFQAGLRTRVKKEYQLPSGRGRLHKLNDFYLVDESYEATPRSVAKAARAMIGFKPFSDKLIYILILFILFFLFYKIINSTLTH